MLDREELIAYFTAQGYEAFARDWSLGKSVGIPWGKSQAGEITLWKAVVYISFIDERWLTYSSEHFQQFMFDTLAEAITKAEELLNDLKLELSTD